MTISEAATPTQATAVVSKSPMRLAMERFRSDRRTMISFWVIVVFAVLTILAPIVNHTGLIDVYHFHQDLLEPDTLPKGALSGVSWKHPLGVEPGSGRDLLARVWVGLAVSVFIALAASLLSMIIGTSLGIWAGMRGGFVDGFVGRLADLILSFPQQLMLLAMSGMALVFIRDQLHIKAADAGAAFYVIVVMAIFGWPGVARLVRGQVLSIREREFVDAAVVLGASRRRIYFKEVLPNLWTLLLVQFTLILPAYISTEAALSFMGVSVKPPTPTLGNVLNDTLNYSSVDFFYFLVPGATIAILVICFNLLGDGLRDALDPKNNR
ncbi:ABC transporter permease [Nocardioides sp. Kera G14]|uniref:ABC transporter permease n=1 Tax=Nocardioides sp. Kera G14 TaxID=2884264 RepID=UPI001D12614A|nr:ABC transporter permease [Nocardioides sp. Kera G14]UDY22172.1 ABC transporter permease [Nocardioides sp. Kera G14]